jgi:hypothetical protein
MMKRREKAEESKREMKTEATDCNLEVGHDAS